MSRGSQSCNQAVREPVTFLPSKHFVVCSTKISNIWPINISLHINDLNYREKIGTWSWRHLADFQLRNSIYKYLTWKTSSWRGDSTCVPYYTHYYIVTFILYKPLHLSLNVINLHFNGVKWLIHLKNEWFWCWQWVVMSCDFRLITHVNCSVSP